MIAEPAATSGAGARRLAAALAVTALLFSTASSAQRRGAAPAKPIGPETASTGFKGGEALARVYDLILDARFPQIEAELRRACGPAPAEACAVLEATAVWWRIQLDPDSRTLDAEFTTSVERAIESAEAWTDREPSSAEAWFYLGAAYAARVQWRVLRDEKLSAARDGKRIKDALERALEIDPDLDDAYFGIGMYRYYAAVAPTAAKIVRFLLLLPGGNRKEGLEQMLRARAEGRLLQGEADYQLHIIYLWYERQTPRALELLRDLHDHYPGNPLFLSQVAEIEDVYEHDITASLETWRTLLTEARTDRLNAPEIGEVRARLGIARQLDAIAETDQAIEHLERIVALKPDAPYSSLALAYLRLGEAHDRMNARNDAMAAYRLASLNAPERDPHNIRREAADRLRRAPNTKHAEAFRLSLDGLRQLEHKNTAGAAAALEQSLALNPRDPVARYRYGRVLLARREAAAALVEFELAIREAKQCPAPILGTIYLETAQLQERAGRTSQALSAYQTAATLFGASDETHRLAARAIARLQK
jgi:tetratricopeptide (TPR) repeat protein